MHVHFGLTLDNLTLSWLPIFFVASRTLLRFLPGEPSRACVALAYVNFVLLRCSLLVKPGGVLALISPYSW